MSSCNSSKISRRFREKRGFSQNPKNRVYSYRDRKRRKSLKNGNGRVSTGIEPDERRFYQVFQSVQPCWEPMTARAMTAPMIITPTKDMPVLSLRHQRALRYLASSIGLMGLIEVLNPSLDFERSKGSSGVWVPFSSISLFGLGGNGRKAATIHANIHHIWLANGVKQKIPS